MDVKVDGDLVEIHLGGGGEGRRGADHAEKVGAGYLRAGGSRVNFRYMKKVTDNDLVPESFLNFMSRVLDVSKVPVGMAAKEFPAAIRQRSQPKQWSRE